MPEGLRIVTQRPGKDLRAWFGAALAEKPDLLIIDSLKSFWPLALKLENSGEFMNTVRDVIGQHRVSILLLHHLRKEPKDFLRDGEESLLEDYVEELIIV